MQLPLIAHQKFFSSISPTIAPLILFQAIDQTSYLTENIESFRQVLVMPDKYHRLPQYCASKNFLQDRRL